MEIFLGREWCGGLGIEGVAYSACASLLQSLKGLLNFVSEKQNKHLIIDSRADSTFVERIWGKLGSESNLARDFLNLG